MNGNGEGTISVAVAATMLSRPPSRGAWAASILTTAAIAIGSVVAWRDLFGLSPWLRATGRQALHEGEVWRLVTTMLVHADLRHLALNAVPIAILAYLVTGYFGPLIHPIASTVLGALVNAIVLARMPADQGLVGASGVVYLLAGFWLTMFVAIDRRYPILERCKRAVGMALIFLVPGTIVPEVSHVTHAIGFCAGVALALITYRLRRDRYRAEDVLSAEID